MLGQECQSPLSALDAAPDPIEARLRLRSALRRITESIWMLIVRVGRDRIAAVQIFFVGGAVRDYLVFNRVARSNAASRTVGRWWARSLATAAGPRGLDLRRPEDAAKLAVALESIDPSTLTDE